MQNKKVTNIVLNSFGMAEFTFAIVMMIAVSYYAFFLTDVAMIGAATMGTILLLARIGDAVSIPLSGAVIQTFQPKLGRFRTWLLVAPPVTALFFILMFTDLHFSPTTKAVFLGFCYIAAHTSINFSSCAHMGLISVLGRTSQERVALSVRKSQFGSAANIVFSLAVIPLVGLLGRGDQGQGFLYCAAIFALLQIAGYWMLFKVSKPYDLPMSESTAGIGRNKLSLKDLVTQIFGNGPLVCILLADSLKFVALFSILGIPTYYFKYIVGNLELVSLFMLVIFIASFVGALLAPSIVRRFGKKGAYIAATLVAALGFMLVRLTAGSNHILYMVFLGLANAGLTVTVAIAPAMYMDAAEYGFFKRGKDGSAFIMSMVSMPIKIGIALSGAVIGYGLAYIGYAPDMVVTQEFIANMLDLNTLLPGACAVAAAVTIFFFNLNEKKVAFYTENNAKARSLG